LIGIAVLAPLGLVYFWKGADVRSEEFRKTMIAWQWAAIAFIGFATLIMAIYQNYVALGVLVLVCLLGLILSLAALPFAFEDFSATRWSSVGRWLPTVLLWIPPVVYVLWESQAWIRRNRS
jgi:hypothetical protein